MNRTISLEKNHLAKSSSAACLLFCIFFDLILIAMLAQWSKISKLYFKIVLAQCESRLVGGTSVYSRKIDDIL